MLTVHLCQLVPPRTIRIYWTNYPHSLDPPCYHIHMAPLRLEFNNFAAFIKVDGQELECHALSVDKEKKHVNCWIASEVGKVSSLRHGFQKKHQ
jgi:hypothetical protein